MEQPHFENRASIEKKYYSKEQIKERLHFYHSTSKEKWEKIQQVGAILSEKELLNRGLINEEQLNDFETTSTGYMDREVGNDNFVFLSNQKENYGDIILEINPNILDREGVLINTAGDYLMFADKENGLFEYHENSQIPGSQYFDYLEKKVNSLPNPEWFFSSISKNLEEDENFKKFIGEAMLEKTQEGKLEKFKLFWSLYPEIKVPKEIPLDYIIKVIDKSDGTY